MQVGVVGLLAHMLHLHMTTSSPSLQCLALSLVPPSHAHSEDSLTLTRLGHLVSWLRDTVPVNKHDSQEVSNSFTWETFGLNMSTKFRGNFNNILLYQRLFLGERAY